MVLQSAFLSLSPSVQIAIYSLGSAAFYCGSMAVMKIWTQAPSILLLALIALLIAVGTVFELLALNQERLGMVYVSILACEVGLIALISLLMFGEHFSVKEALGCAFVVCGVALAWS